MNWLSFFSSKSLAKDGSSFSERRICMSKTIRRLVTLVKDEVRSLNKGGFKPAYAGKIFLAESDDLHGVALTGVLAKTF